MLQQLLIGSILIVITLMIQVTFVSGVSSIFDKTLHYLVQPHLKLKAMVILTMAVLWLLVGISVNAWIWAALFMLLNAFEQLEEALYFSVVTMTSLGYGDIVLDNQWRLLSALTAVNGLIIFGLNTAFLAEFIFILRKQQLKVKKKAKKNKVLKYKNQ